jgi:hypothetical protein
MGKKQRKELDNKVAAFNIQMFRRLVVPPNQTPEHLLSLTADKMVDMTSKPPSGPFLIQHPVAPLLVILAISLICCLSLVGALIKAWLG